MPLLLEECSPQLELLEQLHEALCSYSDAVQALDRFHEVYGEAAQGRTVRSRLHHHDPSPVATAGMS